MTLATLAWRAIDRLFGEEPAVAARRILAGDLRRRREGPRPC